MDSLHKYIVSSNGESIADILSSIRDEIVKMNNTPKQSQNTPNIFDLLGKSMNMNEAEDEDDDEDDDDEDDEDEEENDVIVEEVEEVEDNKSKKKI